MRDQKTIFTPRGHRRIRRAAATLLAMLFSLNVMACRVKAVPTKAQEEIIKTGDDMPVRIEAEDGLVKGASVLSSEIGFSGQGYVGEFKDTGDSVTIEVLLDEDGAFKLSIGYYLPLDSGNKVNTILVNGEHYASFNFQAGEGFQKAYIGPVFLNAGKNSITFTKGQNDWGWMYVDYFELDVYETKARSYEVAEALIDPEATKEAKELYDFLRSNYGSKILSGQQLYFEEEEEISRLLELTGEKPAMKGYDFINQTPGGSIDDQVERAISWVEDEGGILTMCWHWWAPSGGRAFYTADTTFDVSLAVTPGTEEYDLILRDIDIIADLLLDMQARGIPVIWRPLHEASGAWFWWGAKGPEAYQALWDILYDRLVNVHGVHNLIWVANAQDPSWYVGNDKADIIGEDIYPGERVYSAYVQKFEEAFETVDGKKMVALTENGVIPDIRQMQAFDVMWAWNMPWWGDFTTTDKFTEDEFMIDFYQHEDVLNLDDLPVDLYKNTMTYVRRMQPGWNLGNTLDATAGETSWGNPMVTKELLMAIKAEGFKSIRIPVTWNHAVADGIDAIVDEEYMERVETVIQMALDEGFIVMLNMHHDSNWLHDLPNKPELLDRFAKIWEQIANRFKDYPIELMFEAINEPRFSDDWGAENEQFFSLVDGLNNTAYEIIRSSGSQNATRKIVFETLTAGISQARVDRLRASILDKEDPNLVASIHYYGFWPFSVNLAGRTDFDAEVVADVDRQLQIVHDGLVAHGIPVILGEYGLLGFDTSTDTIQQGEKLKFFDYLVHKAEELKITTMLWDNGQHFDREALVWRDKALHETILAAIDGRSGQTAHDTVYIRHDEIDDARMPMLFNGNRVLGLFVDGKEISKSSYKIEQSDLILSKDLILSLSNGEIGRDTVIDIRFSHGPDWQLTLAIVDDLKLLDKEATTFEFTIPFEANAHQIRRVKALDKDGKTIGSESWAQYLNLTSEYEVLADDNLIRLHPSLLAAFGEGELYITVESWSGDAYPYVLTITKDKKVGVAGTIEGVEPEVTLVPEESSSSTEPREPETSVTDEGIKTENGTSNDDGVLGKVVAGAAAGMVVLGGALYAIWKRRGKRK